MYYTARGIIQARILEILQSNGVGSHSLLQGFFPTQGANPGPLHCRQNPNNWVTREALIIGDRNAKVGSKDIPGVTGKFGLGVQNEAEQRLIEFCQENTLIIANTLFQQHKRQFYIWTSQTVNIESDWWYSLQPKMEKLYIVSKNKTGSWLWLRSWTPCCKIQT